MPYSFWHRYLDGFDEVRVIARVRPVVEPESAWKRADGQGISFAAIPYYIGFLQYLQRAFSIRRAAQQAIGISDAIILRVGSPIAANMGPVLRNGRPFGLEIVADPYGVFARRATQHPLRPVLRHLLTAQLASQCWRAAAVAYVTEHQLQKRYKTGPDSFSTYYSSVELSHEWFAFEAKTFSPGGTLRIVSIGSMEQPYKGFDLLLDAVALCRNRGLLIDLVLVGDGRFRPELERRAADLGIGNRVRFVGTLPSGRLVREELDRAQLFVLASRTEGLPRVMIEAMARGLPCVGSKVGGIPELLPPEALVPRDNSDALARKIEEVLIDPAQMNGMAERNLAKAQEFSESILRPRRRRFLTYLRQETERWTVLRGIAEATCPNS